MPGARSWAERARRAAVALIVAFAPVALLAPVHGLAGGTPREISAPMVIPDTTATRFDAGRFSVFAGRADERLGRSLLDLAVRNDTFPGLPAPHSHVVIIVAPDAAHLRAWAGGAVPEWGAAVAIPQSQRVIVQGRAATSAAGDPQAALRHELAHLALHEYLDELPPRWFDEGYASYAAHESGRDEALATNVALALHGAPTLASLDTGLLGGEGEAAVSYALAYRAVADLAALDTARGLSLMLRYWRETGSLDLAVRRAYGEPLDTFEARWRAQTRRRYGALALASDLAFSMLVFLTLLAPLYVARRRRDRARLAVLRSAERAADAAAAAALVAVLAAGAERAESRTTEATRPGSDGALA